jgi:hypothetical protein
MQRAADISMPLVGALVDRARYRAGSRMIAYSDVGRAIGESASWVRKFLGRQPVRLDADTFLAIKAAYVRECERIEAEAELERARFFALGGRLDAMASGQGQQDGLEKGGETSGRRSPSPVVASGVASTLVEERRRLRASNA